MRLPLTMTGALVCASTAAMAQSARHDASKPAQPAPPPAEVVLASADAVHAPAPAAQQPAAAPAKRPAPRITHCRCGDPQVDPETPED